MYETVAIVKTDDVPKGKILQINLQILGYFGLQYDKIKERGRINLVCLECLQQRIFIQNHV